MEVKRSYKFSIISLGETDIKEEVCHFTFPTFRECLAAAHGSLEFFVQPEHHVAHPFFLVTIHEMGHSEQGCICPYFENCSHSMF